MSNRFLASSAVILALALAGCFRSPGGPAQTNKNCSTNTDCTAGNRCLSGACTPGCRGDTDCPDNGVCHPDGTCGTRPACSVDTDCPAAFVCQGGTCACTTDYACWTELDGGLPDTSLICVSGACQASTSCQSNADCTDGRYCGAANVCTAPCIQDSDCGGTSQLGGALTCHDGQCTSPCIADSVPNGGAGGCRDGQICTNGLCVPQQCATFADCGDPTLYCTSATHGHCDALQLCDPSVPDTCGPISECTTYPPDACPPGFDCSQPVCISETACLTDGQCNQDEVCEFGGCRTAPACNVANDCPSNDDCIGGHCVQHVCRGPSDCSNGQICSGGICQAPADGGDVDHVRLLTPIPTLEVGQTEQLAAVALTQSGVARPVDHFDWSTSPDGGAATVDANGLLTAVAPGTATLTVGFTKPNGSQATPDTATFNVIAAASGGRVLVVDSITGAPISGANVRLCQGYDGGTCIAATDLTTDASGTASFTAPTSAYDLSAADPALDSSGRPVHDIVHFLGITTTDVLIPLPVNAAGEEAGFTGSIDFSHVQTTGDVRVGLAGSSISDLASLELEDIVGQQPWTAKATVDTGTIGGVGGIGGIQLPGLDGGTISVPITGATVADVDQLAGLPVSVRIKDTVYALGTPGLRAGWAFAGRVDAQLFFGSYSQSVQTGALGGVLPFFGAFNHGLLAAIDENALPLVLDREDLDGDGVCEDTNVCASGGELLPDYSHFSSRLFAPAQPQSLRVDVLTPSGPDGTGQLILLAGAQVPGAGLLPLGLTSATPGAGQADTIVRLAPLYGGFEASGYALVAMATSNGGGIAGTDGGVAVTQAGGISVAIARDGTLPQQVDLSGAMLPFFANPHYDSAARNFTPGDGWSSIASGAQLLRLAVVGSQQRAFIYASPQAVVGGFQLPLAPGNPASDPALDPSSQATVAALQLPPGDDLDGLASLSGDTLLDLSRLTQGFSRAPAQ